MEYTDYLFYKHLGKSYVKRLYADGILFNLDINEIGIILMAERRINDINYQEKSFISKHEILQFKNFLPSHFKLILRNFCEKFMYGISQLAAPPNMKGK